MKRENATVDTDDLMILVQTASICDSIVSSVLFFVERDILNLWLEQRMKEKEKKGKHG